jgi:hypothetical protein
MKLTHIKQQLTLVPGTYAGQLVGVKTVASKSKANAVNISLQYRVTTDQGNSATVWDLLPDIEAVTDVSKVFWRFEMVFNAFNVPMPEDFTSATVATALSALTDTDEIAWLDIGVEKQQGYAPRNKVVKLTALSNEDIQSVLKAQRHDSDTDSAITPDPTSATGEQSITADRQIDSN